MQSISQFLLSCLVIKFYSKRIENVCYIVSFFLVCRYSFYFIFPFFLLVIWFILWRFRFSLTISWNESLRSFLDRRKHTKFRFEWNTIQNCINNNMWIQTNHKINPTCLYGFLKLVILYLYAISSKGQKSKDREIEEKKKRRKKEYDIETKIIPFIYNKISLILFSGHFFLWPLLLLWLQSNWKINWYSQPKLFSFY